jgi:hypothetical protein
VENPKYSALLSALRAEGLIPDPDLDFSFLVELYRLSLDLVSPRPSREVACLLYPAVRVGNVLLYRPSIGLQWFLRDRGLRWFPKEDPLAPLMLAFCLAHARLPEALWGFADRDAMAAEVVAWGGGVGCSLEELDEACVRLFEGERPAPAPAAPDGVPAVPPPRSPVDAATLEQFCLDYGVLPEDAIWRRPAVEVELLAQAAATRREGEGGVDPDRVRRNVSLNAFLGEFRERLSARRSSAGAGP